MDPERQPLLRRGHAVNCRRFRPLTTEEVLTCRKERSWRRVRLSIQIMFWAIMAMILSAIATILLQAPRCPTLSPTVPPVHLSLAPLINLKESVDQANMAWMA